MPAVASTPTAIDWPKANLDAPDARHEMALIHVDVDTGAATIHDMRGYKKARYHFADHNLTGEVLRGTVTRVEYFSPGGSVESATDITGTAEIRPARGCSCTGYKRTLK